MKYIKKAGELLAAGFVFITVAAGAGTLIGVCLGFMVATAKTVTAALS